MCTKYVILHIIIKDVPKFTQDLCGKVLPMKKKDSMTANSSGLLKIKCHTKEQRVFIVKQFLKIRFGNYSSQFLYKISK